MNQMDPATTMGPLISAKQKERVTGHIESGKTDAKLVHSTEIPKRAGAPRPLCFGPTIFDGVQNSMKIAREEIFGPVLSSAHLQGRRRSANAGERLPLRPRRLRHHPRCRPCDASGAGL